MLKPLEGQREMHKVDLNNTKKPLLDLLNTYWDYAMEKGYKEALTAIPVQKKI